MYNYVHVINKKCTCTLEIVYLYRKQGDTSTCMCTIHVFICILLIPSTNFSNFSD